MRRRSSPNPLFMPMSWSAGKLPSLNMNPMRTGLPASRTAWYRRKDPGLPPAIPALVMPRSAYPRKAAAACPATWSTEQAPRAPPAAAERSACPAGGVGSLRIACVRRAVRIAIEGTAGWILGLPCDSRRIQNVAVDGDDVPRSVADQDGMLGRNLVQVVAIRMARLASCPDGCSRPSPSWPGGVRCAFRFNAAIRSSMLWTWSGPSQGV